VVPPIDVRALARRQHGVVTRAQLLQLGFTEDEVRNRVRKGWLERVYRGVYALGPLSDRGRVHASTLATGPYAAASFSSATALYRLTPPCPPFSTCRSPAGTGETGRV
jgi:predicted transcriptional regulator of viral defense system